MYNFKKTIVVSIVYLLCVSIGVLSIPVIYFESKLCLDDFWIKELETRNSIAGSIDTVFVGASHALCCFVPSKYDEINGTNSYNLSGCMLSMKNRYDFLKKEIAGNPIKRVYLELSYNSLSRGKDSNFEADAYYFGRLSSFKERFHMIIHDYSIDDYDDLLSYSLINGTFAIWDHFSKDSDNTDEDLQFDKGYLKNPVRDLTEKQDENKETTDIVEVDTNIEQVNITYLKRILELCASNNIEIIMITVPISDSFVRSSDNFDTIYNQYVEIAEQNSICYFDFNLLKNRHNLFSDSSSFNDEYHMSENGAPIFTAQMSYVVNEALNGNDVSKLFYNSYEEMKADSPYIDYYLQNPQS